MIAQIQWPAILVALGLTPLVAGAPADNPSLPVHNMPGTVIFHGRYQHRNTGREIEQPSELWLKQTADGALTAIAEVPFMNSTEIAASDTAGRFTSHRMLSRASGNRPGVEVKLEFQDGKARLTRRGLRQDCDGKELAVPSGALFDPEHPARFLLRREHPAPRVRRETGRGKGVPRVRLGQHRRCPGRLRDPG